MHICYAQFFFLFLLKFINNEPNNEIHNSYHNSVVVWPRNYQISCNIQSLSNPVSQELLHYHIPVFASISTLVWVRYYQSHEIRLTTDISSTLSEKKTKLQRLMHNNILLILYIFKCYYMVDSWEVKKSMEWTNPSTIDPTKVHIWKDT